MTQKTPISWEVVASKHDHNPIHQVTDGDDEVQCITYNKETAEFIARACNSHDKLVEALEDAVLIAEDEQAGNWDDLLQYRAVINKARGQA